MSHIRTKISNVQCTSTKLSTLLTNTISSISKITNLNMPNSKRPTCPNCTKPLPLCLCTRLKTPILENQVHITILQHSLERKHPLNSAKIARLGLRNVNVYTVTDVMFEAQFDFHQLSSDSDANLSRTECTSSVCVNASENFDCEASLEVKRARKWDFDHLSDHDSAEEEQKMLEQSEAEIISCCDDLILSVTVGKYGEISNIVSHQSKFQQYHEIRPNNLDHLISTPEFMDRFVEGFVVKKLQKKQRNDSIELEQFEEFQINVLPGSALLFPAQKAVTVEAVEFEVKNLIVLDGTWAKANRMYNENPWLKMLPCVRLDVEKMSMFSEVRHQPKAGYLSTIESVVYALQALEGSEQLVGLTNLLDVFESMVEDQRKYKDNRLKKQS